MSIFSSRKVSPPQAGYRDGLPEGKERTLQHGFDAGVWCSVLALILNLLSILMLSAYQIPSWPCAADVTFQCL